MTFKIGQVGDLLRGGKGDFRPDSAFSPEQLAKGKKHEREHTKNPQITKEIAKDHLSEDPSYYTKLEKIEKKADTDSKARNKQDAAQPDLAHNRTNLLQIPQSTKQLEDAMESVENELGTIQREQQQTGDVTQPPTPTEREKKLKNQASALRKVFRQRNFNVIDDLTEGEMQELADGFNIEPYDPLKTKQAFEIKPAPEIKDDRLFELPTAPKPEIQPHMLANKIPTTSTLANSDNSDYKRPVHNGAGSSIEDPGQIVMDSAHTKNGEERPRAEVIVHTPKGILGRLAAKHWFKIPGGGIDKGERPVDAARRETIEESGHNLGELKHVGVNRYEIPPEQAAKSKHKNTATVNHLFVAKSVGKMDVKHKDLENYKIHPFKKVIKILADAIKSPAHSLFKLVNKRRLQAVMDLQRSVKMALFNPQEVKLNMFFEGITDDLLKQGYYIERPVEFFVGCYEEIKGDLLGDQTKTASAGYPPFVVDACRNFARKHELFKAAAQEGCFTVGTEKQADFSQLKPINPMGDQKIEPPQAGAISPVRMERRQDIVDALLPYAQGITVKPDGEIKLTMPDYSPDQNNLGVPLPGQGAPGQPPQEEQMARAKAQQFSDQSLQESAQQAQAQGQGGGAAGATPDAVGGMMPPGSPEAPADPMAEMTMPGGGSEDPMGLQMPGQEAGATPMGGGKPDVAKLMQALSTAQM